MLVSHLSFLIQVPYSAAFYLRRLQMSDHPAIAASFHFRLVKMKLTEEQQQHSALAFNDQLAGASYGNHQDKRHMAAARREWISLAVVVTSY